MGWGGARIGAGRKPRSERAVVLGMDGTRIDAGRPRQDADPGDPLLIPPAGMTAAQQKYWMLWAPLAIAQRTLTQETIPGFREACELAAMKDPIAKQIRKLGPESDEAIDLRRDYLKFSKDLRIALQQYKLGAFGRPEQAPARRQAQVTSPWAAVGK